MSAADSSNMENTAPLPPGGQVPPAPLDLGQFQGREYREGDARCYRIRKELHSPVLCYDCALANQAPSLLAECRRQREEIARLRWHLDAVLNQRESLSLVEGRAPGEVLYMDRVFREARAALRSAGEGA